MRCKHPEEYEASKTVALKRIAWSTDEDRVLAKLELSLKATQRGQILTRLCAGYNEITAKSKAPPRSKEAIRGRRQQPDYKALMDELNNNADSDSDDDSASQANTNPVSTCTVNNPLSGIRKFLEEHLKNKSSLLSKDMSGAINQ